MPVASAIAEADAEQPQHLAAQDEGLDGLAEDGVRAALPAVVLRLTLYFEAGGNTLTPASAEKMTRWLDILRAHPAAAGRPSC